MSHLYTVPIENGHMYVSDVKDPSWDYERVQIDLHNGDGSVTIELSFEEAYLLEVALNKIRTSSNEGIHESDGDIQTT